LPFCCLFGGDGVEEGGVGEVVGDEVDVGGEGESGRVVAKPDLDLFGVEAVPEEDGGAGVAEGVEASPGDAGFAGGWFEDSGEDFGGVDVLPARVDRLGRGVL